MGHLSSAPWWFFLLGLLPAHAELELWSLLEPCSCRTAWSLTPDSASDSFNPSFSASSGSFRVLQALLGLCPPCILSLTFPSPRGGKHML